MTIARGLSDNVISIKEVSDKELVQELFRNNILELSRMPIEPIMLQSVKEVVDYYDGHDSYHVLNAKVETIASAAGTYQIQLSY